MKTSSKRILRTVCALAILAAAMAPTRAQRSPLPTRGSRAPSPASQVSRPQVPAPVTQSAPTVAGPTASAPTVRQRTQTQARFVQPSAQVRSAPSVRSAPTVERVAPPSRTIERSRPTVQRSSPARTIVPDRGSPVISQSIPDRTGSRPTTIRQPSIDTSRSRQPAPSRSAPPVTRPTIQRTSPTDNAPSRSLPTRTRDRETVRERSPVRDSDESSRVVTPSRDRSEIVDRPETTRRRLPTTDRTRPDTVDTPDRDRTRLPINRSDGGRGADSPLRDDSYTAFRKDGSSAPDRRPGVTERPRDLRGDWGVRDAMERRDRIERSQHMVSRDFRTFQTYDRDDFRPAGISKDRARFYDYRLPYSRDFPEKHRPWAYDSRSDRHDSRYFDRDRRHGRHYYSPHIYPTTYLVEAPYWNRYYADHYWWDLGVCGPYVGSSGFYAPWLGPQAGYYISYRSGPPPLSYHAYRCAPYRYYSYTLLPWYSTYYYNGCSSWSTAVSYAPGFAAGFYYQDYDDDGFGGIHFGFGYGGGVRFGSTPWYYSWYPYGGYQQIVVADAVPDVYSMYVAPQVQINID